MTPLVVMTKDAIAGRVKTRLIPALGEEGARKVHVALVERTFDIARRAGIPTVVRLDGDLDGPIARAARALGFQVLPQGVGDLGQRLCRALGSGGLAIGTDAPLIDPTWLTDAVARSEPLVLGPSEDGGYWAVGLRTLVPTVFEGIPWSTPRVFEVTRSHGLALGLEVGILPVTYDVDEPADLLRLQKDPRCPPPIYGSTAPMEQGSSRGSPR